MNIRNTANGIKSYQNLEMIALAERTLNAAAHPFRLQLIENIELGELYTAKQLARCCRMPLDRTIQHLRILVKYKLVDFLSIGYEEFYRLNQSGYERIINSSTIFSDFADFE